MSLSLNMNQKKRSPNLKKNDPRESPESGTTKKKKSTPHTDSSEGASRLKISVIFNIKLRTLCFDYLLPVEMETFPGR